MSSSADVVGGSTVLGPRLLSDTLASNHILLSSPLGSGTYGSVHSAVDVRTDAEVAVKVIEFKSPTSLSPALTTDTQIVRAKADAAEAQEYFKIEVENMEMLADSDHVVSFERSFLVKKNRRSSVLGGVIVMELADAKDLEKLLQESSAADGDGCISLKLALQIGVGIVRALVDIHAKGLVHRDCKPANVLLYRNKDASIRSVKMADLGLAADIASDDPVSGTPQYFSSSCLRTYLLERDDSPLVHKGEDVFALALILYEMFGMEQHFLDWNQARFEAVHSPKLWKSLPEHPPLDGLRGKVDQDLLQMMLKCWSSKPDSRPSAAEMEQALLKAAERLQMSSQHEHGVLSAGEHATAEIKLSRRPAKTFSQEATALNEAAIQEDVQEEEQAAIGSGVNKFSKRITRAHAKRQRLAHKLSEKGTATTKAKPSTITAKRHRSA